MTTLRTLLRTLAATVLLGQATACGVVEDFAGAAAVDPADFEQIAAQVPAPMVALERAFPGYEPRITLDLVDGARTVQVRLTRNAAEATSDDAEAVEALSDAAMAVALAAMTDRAAFDAAELVVVTRPEARGGAGRASGASVQVFRRSISEWEGRLDLPAPAAADSAAPLLPALTNLLAFAS